MKSFVLIQNIFICVCGGGVHHSEEIKKNSKEDFKKNTSLPFTKNTKEDFPRQRNLHNLETGHTGAPC